MKNHVKTSTTKNKTKVRRRSQEVKSVVKRSEIIKVTEIDRHKLLLRTISDNLGNGMTMGEAMVSVGYSKSYSESPVQLKRTDAWKELTDKELGDESLIKVHKKLLNHKQWRANDAGLDKAYKLKGRYKDESTITHKFGGTTDEELERELAKELSTGISNQEGTEPKKGEQQS